MAGLQKAFIQTELGDRIACMFNPEQFAFSMANSWSRFSGTQANIPSMTFTGGESGSFSLTLEFDTTDTGRTVTERTNKLLQLMKVDTRLPDFDTARNSGRPQWITFNWGKDIHTFKAVITSLDVSFTYFASSGTPLRAKVDLRCTQFEEDDVWARQNPTSGTPKPQRTHQVQPGETLDRIAAQHYGDATQWRRIAGANGVRDPLAVPPGTILAIPDRND